MLCYSYEMDWAELSARAPSEDSILWASPRTDWTGNISFHFWAHSVFSKFTNKNTKSRKGHLSRGCTDWYSMPLSYPWGCWGFQPLSHLKMLSSSSVTNIPNKESLQRRNSYRWAGINPTFWDLKIANESVTNQRTLFYVSEKSQRILFLIFIEKCVFNCYN